MTAALLALAFAAGGEPRVGAGTDARELLEAGRSAFNLGRFEQAMARFDSAADAAHEVRLLSAIHLARAECLAVLGDLAAAESAFVQALRLDPQARLDVDHTRASIVALFERVRDRLAAQLIVRRRAGAGKVILDGAPLGAAPLTSRVSVGAHRLELVSEDGCAQVEDIVARPGERIERAFPLRGSRAYAEGTGFRPFGELRGALHPFHGAQAELGLGVSYRFLSLSASGGFGPVYGGTLRLRASAPPVATVLRFYGSLEAPVLAVGSPATMGAGLALGVLVEATPWLAPFVEVAARRFFTMPPPHSRNYLLLAAGVRVGQP